MESRSNSEKNEQQKQKNDEARHSLLAKILTPEARDRSLVKPEKAAAVQTYLIQMAQRGSLRDRVDEPALISFLSASSVGSPPEFQPAITILKRPSDQDEDLDLSQFLPK